MVKDNREELSRKEEREKDANDYLQDYVEAEREIRQKREKGEAMNPIDEEHLKDIKSDWKKKYPLKSFDKALEEYKADLRRDRKREEKVDAPAAAPKKSAKRPEAPTPEIDIVSLKQEVENYLKSKNTASFVAQELIKNGLTPTDLADANSNRRKEAVEVALASKPNLKLRMLAALNEPRESEEFKIADEQLKEIAEDLRKPYEVLSRVSENIEEYKEDIVGSTLQDGLDNLMESAKEKPITTLVGLGLVLIVGKSIYDSNFIGDDVRGWIKTGLWGLGGAWGLNMLVGALSPSGRTILDRVAFNSNTFEYDPVMTRFKTEIQKLNPKSRHAFDAMMHLGKAKASSVAAAFDSAFRAGEKEIDPQDLFAAGEITAEQARAIDSAGLYEGLEALMLQIAHEKCNVDPKRKDKAAIQEGLNFFKDHYARQGKDFQMFNVIVRMANDHEPTEVDDNGYTDRNSPEYSENPYKGKEDLELENKIEAVLKAHSVTGLETVEAFSGGWVHINGYPFEFKQENDKYVLTDKVEGGKFTISDKADAQKCINYVEPTMKKRFDEAFALPAPQTVKYERVGTEWGWYIRPAEKQSDVATLFTPSSDLEIYALPERNKKGMKLRRPGDMATFKTIADVRKSAENAYVMEKVGKDIDYLLEGVKYNITKTEYVPADGSRVITIEYQAKWGRTIPEENTFGFGEINIPGKKTATIVYDRLGEIQSVGGLIAPKAAELSDKQEKLFKRIDKLQWSLGLAKQYEAYVELYRTQMRRQLNDALLTSQAGRDPEREINDLFAKWEADISRFEALQSQSQNVAQLREVYREINRNMIDNDEAWEVPSFEFVEMLSGKYEFEHHFLFNNPWIWKSYLNVYYEKMNYGKNDATRDEAERYNRFYISKFTRLISDDWNKSLTNWDGVVASENTKEWSQHIVNVRRIESFEEWRKLSTQDQEAPEIAFLDEGAKLEARERKEFDDADKEFMKKFWDDGWLYDTGIVHNEWFRHDLGWPELFKSSVEERMGVIRDNTTDIVEYRKKLIRLADFVAYEGKLCDVLIEDWMKKSQFLPINVNYKLLTTDMTLGDVVKGHIDKLFTQYFNAPSATPRTYGNALASELAIEIGEAKFLDTFAAQIGGKTIPFPDPFRLI
ncbi:hypothetical protein KKC94_00835 [Patescibacteria group bacterium]|nr:hypothetical protein [Patescibacteria group bacterium]